MQFSLEVETKNFNKHIADFWKKSNLSTEIVLKKFAFDLLAKIIRKTPVDTGRARGGWMPALEELGKGSLRTIEINISEGSKNFSEVAFNEGKAEGQFIDNTKGFMKEKWIEIINGVEYVIFLEYGHSQQRPYGMVRLSMREMSKSQLPKDMVKEMQIAWKSFEYYGAVRKL